MLKDLNWVFMIDPNPNETNRALSKQIESICTHIALFSHLE